MADWKTIPWKSLAEMKYVGHSVQRIDIKYRVRGTAKYTQDVYLPGMLYGAILRSPHPHARIRSIDLTAAKAHPEVRAAINLDKKTVRYAGDEIAAVAATTQEAAWDALKLIKVEYEPLGFVVTEQDSMRRGAPRIHEDGNVRGGDPSVQGDPDSAFRRAAAVVEGSFYNNVALHAALETHCAVAYWEDDKLIYYGSQQGVLNTKNALVKHFDVPATKVQVITDYMGGGFGAKIQPAGVEGIACAELARQAGAPVKMVLTRHEEMLAVGNRPSAFNRIRLAADKEGNLTAFESDSYGTGGYSGGSGFPSPYIYDLMPNQRRRHRNVSVNAGNDRPMRAPGHPQGAYGMEQAMDMLADKLGMDPLELCKKNDPNPRRVKQYDIGAELIGWDRRRKPPGSDPGPLKRGLGVGSGTWGGGGGRSNKVDVRIHPDGSVEAAEASQCLGTGTRTFIAQIVAEELGIPIEGVTVKIGNSDYPQGNTSAGSTTAPSTAPVIKNGADMARAKLFEKVAPKLDAAPEELVAENGRIFVKYHPERGLDWKAACRLLGNQSIDVLGEWTPGLSGSESAAVQFAEVEVDVETGKIRVIKMVSLIECGLVLNRLTAESQITGGMVMSIGYALSECRRMDSQEGRVINPNMIDYKVAGSLEMPEMVVVLQDYPERGVIGIGEPPTIPTAAAIANAVANATGARIYELPMTQDVVLAALGRV